MRHNINIDIDFFPETVRQRLAAKKSVVTTPATAIDIHAVKVSLKDLVCYLSLLEGGRPEDKLECKSVRIPVRCPARVIKCVLSDRDRLY